MRFLLFIVLLLVLPFCKTFQPCQSAWKFFNLTNSCYFTGHWETQASAEDTCNRNDAHLTSVHSEKENTWINGLYFPEAERNAPDYTWLGLTREKGSFGWTDGSPVDFSRWASHPGKKECVVQDAKTLRWMTVRCDVKIHKYVCKKTRFNEK